MAVELGRASHRLAGVVDDEVEPVACVTEMPAEGLDARCVTQVEPEDLQPVAPFVEVGFRRVAGRAVAREASRHDQVRACAQQLDACLVPDLDASAGEERNAPAQICRLRTLAEVEVAASRTELVVEAVNGDVQLLADVAVLGLDDLTRLGVVDLVGLDAL